jgi:hypothetical protein
VDTLAQAQTQVNNSLDTLANTVAQLSQGQLVDKSDLESLISREGYNQVFMAGWYREYEKLPTFKVFNIVQFGKRTCWKMT